MRYSLDIQRTVKRATLFWEKSTNRARLIDQNSDGALFLRLAVCIVNGCFEKLTVTVARCIYPGLLGRPRTLVNILRSTHSAKFSCCCIIAQAIISQPKYRHDAL